MRRDKKAKKYAQALMVTASKVDAVNDVSESLRILANLVKNEVVFKVFFQSRKITSEGKKTILRKVLGEKCHSIVSELFVILAGKKEYHLLSPIASIFANLRIKEMNILPIKLVTAEKLHESEYQKMRESLENISSQTLEVDYQLNSEIIGGIKLQLGNIYMDNSIRGGMEKIRQQLIQE